MFTLVAWFESVDPAGARVAINAVADDTVFTDGDNVRVPAGFPNIIGQAALINDASGLSAQFQAPSLRQLANIDIEPIILAALFGSPPEVLYHPLNPNPLAVDEGLQFHAESNPAAPAAHYGIAWLGDGPQQPVQGNIFSLGGTTGITQVAGSWTTGEITFDQSLPVGRYQVVGWRARSTDGVVARMHFRGGVPRPGVAMVNAIGDEDPGSFRYGRTGVFGEFHTNTPPAVEVLGGVAVAQVHTFDLIRVG